MPDSLLQIIQNRWQPPVYEANELEEALPHELDEYGAIQAVEVAADTQGPAVPVPEMFSCEWVGWRFLGHVSMNVTADTKRLIEIMWDYPIRPHLNTGGGSGFTYPSGYEWRVIHDELVKEFSRLWFSRAGDLIIEKYGHRMPKRKPALPKEPVLPDEALECEEAVQGEEAVQSDETAPCEDKS